MAKKRNAAPAKTSFQKAVEATPEIATAYRKGLGAFVGEHSKSISVADTTKLEGSINLDSALQKLYPGDARWDYAFGYAAVSYFVEVHPAGTSNVDEVLKKKAWLVSWLKNSAPELYAMKAKTPLHWIPTGGNAILKGSRQARLVAQHGINITKRLSVRG